MTDNGYNPMGWNCAKKGCFNIFSRAKIEMFAEDLPRNIAMGDIDATVEVNGHFLFLEFKTTPRYIKTGQRIYFQKLTRLSDKITVIVIYADPETMECYEFCSIEEGRISCWQQCTLKEIKACIKEWGERAEALRLVL
jgi:hypothetical protein